MAEITVTSRTIPVEHVRIASDDRVTAVARSLDAEIEAAPRQAAG